MRGAIRFAWLTFGFSAVAAACGTTSFNGDDSATTSDAATTDATSAGDASPPTPDANGGSGTLTPLLSIALAEGIFVDKDYVYYTTANYAAAIGEVGRISKGSRLREVISNGEGPAMQVVTIDDDYVFWTEWDLSFNTGTGGVRGKRATSGVPAATLMSAPGAWFGAAAIGPMDVIGAQFGGLAYDFTAASTPDSGVTAVPFVYADGGSFTYAEPSHYALDQGNLYWTDEDVDSRGGVYSASAANGGTVTQLVKDPLYAWGIAVNADYIVYSTYNGDNLPNGGTLVRLDRATGGNSKILTDAFARIAGIAIVGANVYFCDNDASVWRVPLDGSSVPVAIATGQAGPHSLATDGAALYWTNGASGSAGGVMRYQL